MPDIGFVPDHPPDAEQDVAFVADQLSVELPFVAMVRGLAARDTLTTPGLGVGPGVVVDVVLATFVPPLLPPAPPPQPAISDTNKMNRNASDTGCEIRGRHTAIPACLICIP